MIFAAFETVFIAAYRDGLPARIEQRTGDLTAMAQLTFLLGLLILLCLPYAVMGAAAAGDPAILAGFTDQPRALILVLTGLGLGVFLLGVPALGCLQRLARRRQITLTRGYVEVVDRHLFGSMNWGCPLRDFTGVAHHVRTHLSSARHELILVHPSPKRCLLLRVGNNISLDDMHRLAELLGLPVISVAVIYAGHSAGIKTSGELEPIANISTLLKE